MKKIAFLILILGWVTDAQGCLNGEYYELKDGSVLYQDYDERIYPRGHDFFVGEFDGALHNLDSLWKKTKDVGYLSDYALILALKKQYDESARIYLQIEQMFPGRYSTASNLGTVYELMGQNENALQWISKAVAIDPQSHKGSEWLHVNILKAKIQGDTAVNSKFLLGTDFGDGVSPTTQLDFKELIRLRDALYYQLNERVTFVKPPDKIVALLLFNLADIAWLTEEQNDALAVYGKAKEYGMDGDLFVSRYNHAGIRFNLKPVDSENKYRMFIPLMLGGLGLFVAAVFAVVRRVRAKE
jgi:tetratricopeptide (TPR) repeat protein